MRLILNRDLFEPQSQEEAVALVQLFSEIASQKILTSALLTNPIWDADADNGPIDTWLEQRPGIEAYAFREVLLKGPMLASMQRPWGADLFDVGNLPHWYIVSPPTINVERCGISDWKARRLTLYDAVDLVREPLHLLLENRRSDFVFLQYLAGPANGQALRDLGSAPGRLEILGGGCGEIKKWLEDLNAEKNANNTSFAWRRLLRTWVMLDRDTGNQDALQPSKNATDLLGVLKQIHDEWDAGPSWICLGRREIESYVPDDGLRQAAGTPKKAFADKVIQWRGDTNSATWAWILDLKKGLRGDLRTDLDQQTCEDLKKKKIPLAAPMLKSPFDSLNPQDIQRLEHGFDKRLGEGMLLNPPPGWVHSIPAEYDRGPFRQPSRLELIQSLFDRV